MAYSCSKCKESFEKYKEMLRHRRSMSHWQEVKCDVCGFLCKGKEYMKRHVNVKHTERKLNHLCETCGSCYMSANSLYRHRRRKHRSAKSDKKQNEDIPEYIALLVELRKLISENRTVPVRH